jgi:hypothetical protein
VQTYALYVDDDRYSVPSLFFVTAEDEAALRRIGRQTLADPHHRSVEVRDGDRMLFRLSPSSFGSEEAEVSPV